LSSMNITKPLTIPILETKRLILRPFCLNDAPEVQRLAGDRAVADMTINFPYPYRDGMAEEWISGHQEEFSSGHGVIFAIVSRKEGYLIGAMSLREISKDHQATLGYWIGKPFWNQGFCTEAGWAVLDFAFMVIGIDRIRASHIARNPASGRVMRKLGMCHDGTGSQHVIKWDKHENVEIYAISKSEWKNTTNHGDSLSTGRGEIMNKRPFGTAKIDDAFSPDPRYEKAVESILRSGQASARYLQRTLKMGYARAARIIDQMECEKIIGPFEGPRCRDILVDRTAFLKKMVKRRNRK
jgi:ribosomal-protein-alanine N-acetyltransferase